ncbi:MAG TPA: TonB-dependent receptor [Steroidobacteraceae bacterium]|jgi:vitamin B12 transporter
MITQRTATLLAIILAQGFLIQGARADDSAAGAPAANDLEQVVVTATRTAQPAGQALEPIILIDRAAIEDSLGTDIGDLLRFHAGLDIGRSGGPGQPLSLFIRGTNSDQAIVMVDGVRINSGTLGAAPLQNLAPELFERIEIIEGPRSAIYGTDAIGGVVNLVTHTGGASGADAMVDYGRYGSGEFALGGNYAGSEGTLQAALTGQRSNGFPPFDGDTQDSSYQNWSGIASAATRIAGVDLGGFYWRSSGTSQYANPDYNSSFTAFAGFTPLDERFSNSAAALHAGGDITDYWHARATLSRIIDDISQEQPDVFTPNLAPDYDYTARDTLDLQNDVTIALAGLKQVVTFGAILAREQTNSLSFGTAYSIRTDTETYYLQDQLEAGANRLLLAGGDYHHPAFGEHQTWNAEYGYALTPDTLLIASAGTAFRAPSATDRFGFGGTPDLLPESSRNFELGIKARLNDSQQVTFSAFQDTINDLIEFVSDPANLVYGGENRNIDRARIRGLEAGWELHTAAWSVNAAASLQDPRDLSAGDADTELIRRTKQSFTLTGSRRFARAELGLDLLQSGPRQDIGVISGAPVSDGGYLLAGIWAKLALTPAWSLTARLDNVLNRSYQLANGYNTAGRAISVATRYSLR